jgi:DNA-binding transcriptional regulator GbsR (MarR family)
MGHKPHRGANPRPAVLSERALNAEEFADTLSVARSNVSNSLKELQGWASSR